MNNCRLSSPPLSSSPAILLQIEAKDEEKNEETDISNNQLESNSPTENIVQDISSIEIETPKVDISENLVSETIDVSNNVQNNIEEEVPTENEFDNAENLEETEDVEQQIDAIRVHNHQQQRGV